MATFNESVEVKIDGLICKVSYNTDDLIASLDDVSDDYLRAFTVPATLNLEGQTYKVIIGDGAFYSHPYLENITIENGVTSIGRVAFFGCSSLTSITIPDSVTSIGAQAFYNCTNLRNITIGDSVTNIGDYTFYCCEYLTSVVIPDSVTSIGEKAFYKCTRLESVTIGKGVISIGKEAFSYCHTLKAVYISDIAAWCNIQYVNGGTASPLYYAKKLYLNEELVTNLVIPDSVTNIGADVFQYCESLTSITIPDSVTTIGAGAFYGCINLERVENGKGITSIGNSAFTDCSSLTSITIPDGVTKIGYQTFKDCIRLKNIIIPDSVTSIGEWAFDGCSNLINIIIPDSVESIGKAAFQSCRSLVRVVIGKKVRSIDDYAFASCLNLVEVCNLSTFIVIQKGSENYGYLGYYAININNKSEDSKLQEKDGYIFYCDDETGEYYLVAYTGWNTELILPDNINGNSYAIYQYLFYEQSKITTIVIHSDSVTSIGDYAFYGCTSLTSIETPDSVTSIGSSAFEGCSELITVSILGAATSLGQNAFVNCNKIQTLRLNTINTAYIHQFRSLTSITKVYVSAENFGNMPTSIVTAEIVSGTKLNGNYNFKQLTTLTICDTITEIGSSSHYYILFTNCTNIQTVILPALAINYIPKNSLKTVVITSGDVIKTNAFKHSDESITTELDKLTIPQSVIRIEDDAFAGCKIGRIYYQGTKTQWNIIENIAEIDSSVTEDIAYEAEPTFAFSDPDKNGECWVNGVTPQHLTVLYIPEVTPDGYTVVGIANNAFESHINLQTINIPNTVKFIGEEAFSGCVQLKNISMPDSIQDIGTGAFNGCDKIICYIPSDGSRFLGNTENQNVVLMSAPKGQPHYTIPEGTKCIYEKAFSGRGELETIKITNNVVGIGIGAFLGCSSLTTITLPFIGPNLYYDPDSDDPSTSLIKTNFSYLFVDSLNNDDGEKYNYEELYDKVPTTLEEITINNGNIYQYAIGTNKTSSLKTININISGRIYKQGLHLLPTVKTITLGLNALQLDEGSIYSHESLEEIIVYSDSADYYVDNGCLINKRSGTIITSTKKGRVSASTGATTIGPYSYITSIPEGANLLIPDNIKHINSYAFAGTKLNSITFPMYADSIDDFVLQGCEQLTEMTIPFITTSDDKDPCREYLARVFGYRRLEEGESCDKNMEFEVYENDATYCFKKPPLSLKKVALTNTREIIKKNFYGFDNLEIISIPRMVETIQNHSFVDMPSLNTVYYNATRIAIKPSEGSGRAVFGWSTGEQILDIRIGERVGFIPAYLFKPETDDYKFKISNLALMTRNVEINSHAFGDAIEPITVYYFDNIIYKDDSFGNNITLKQQRHIQFEDFLGFTYNGYHSIGDLKIYRTSNSNRYNHNITATMSDKTTDIPGGDGQYYFGTTFKNRTFTINYVFDSLTDKDLRLIKQVFRGDGIHELGFDEIPYRSWSAKVTGTATMKYLVFEENGQRIYKGEGSITFTCYSPYARTPKKLFYYDQAHGGELHYGDRDGRYLNNYDEFVFPTKSEWASLSGLVNQDEFIQGYNPGDLPVPFVFKTSEKVNKNQTLTINDSTITLTKDSEGPVTWDSKVGLVYETVLKDGKEQKIIIPHIGDAYAMIPVNMEIDEAITIAPAGTLDYDYLYC